MCIEGNDIKDVTKADIKDVTKADIKDATTVDDIKFSFRSIFVFVIYIMVVLVHPCLYDSKKNSIFHYSSRERDHKKLLLRILELYDKKGDINYSKTFFTKHCVKEQHPEFGLNHTPGIVYTRNKDFSKKPTDEQIKNIKSFYEKCNNYVINLSLPEMYMLFNYDIVTEKTDAALKKNALLFQIFAQCKDKNKDLFSFYHMLDTNMYTDYDINKAIDEYWKDINNIIKNAPSIPENCPIVLYRGSKAKENTYKKPFSTTTNFLIAKGYQGSNINGYFNIYYMKKGTSILPLFTIDKFPEESEILISSDFNLRVCKEEKKQRYFSVT